ncbi:hypothetical protein [Cupriavidus sp. IDO]|uniref:hypothetical protein n=1 Tax=Cupriavidus sp. IDO TaxID=1539142 RepID=UPI0005799279|nr:hypothetical protein [Cupriavidus sp. IDO]KWR74636.1 hypothetical protein RM96_35550 [Cupriavidus sp. IDO]
MTDASDKPSTPPAPSPPKPQLVPTGYRQGIITAITVLLGFSLAFWRFWGFESPGHWNARALFAAVSLVAAVTLQIISLFRALRIEDDEVGEYRRTVRWFIASAIALLVGLFAAMLDAALGS